MVDVALVSAAVVCFAVLFLPIDVSSELSSFTFRSKQTRAKVGENISELVQEGRSTSGDYSSKQQPQ